MDVYSGEDFEMFCQASLKRLAKTGFQTPIMMIVASGQHGCFNAVRWDGTENPPEQLALHPAGEAIWSFPLHVFFISSIGDVVRAIVQEEDAEPQMVN